MHMYELINKKKHGGTLNRAELDYIVSGTVSGAIPDYQLSAFLMAVCFQGMTPEETAELTLSMAHSGDMADLSAISGIKADKHSTGGVGDKTTPCRRAHCRSLRAGSCQNVGQGPGAYGRARWINWSPFPVSARRSPGKNFTRLRKKPEFVSQDNRQPCSRRQKALRAARCNRHSRQHAAYCLFHYEQETCAGADVILLDVKYGSGAFLSEPRTPSPWHSSWPASVLPPGGEQPP